jgi:hypothetical protein
MLCGVRFRTIDIKYEPGDVFTLWLTSDWHRLNRGCDIPLLEKTWARIKQDPKALWAFIGDGWDCITTRDQKRWNSHTIDYDIVSPEKLDSMTSEVVKDGVNILKNKLPMDRCVVFHEGNHERHLRQESTTDILSDMLERVGRRDLYVPGNCTTTIAFHHNKHKAEFVMNSGHGNQAAQLVSTCIAGMVNKMKFYGDIDLLVRGHSHQYFLQPVAKLDRKKKKDDFVDHVLYVCHSGSYLRTYGRDVEGYGEVADYAPTVLGSPRLLLRPAGGRVYMEARI